MEIKDLEQISQNMREVFERAQESSKNDNPDYAIELLCDLVANSPGLLPARILLREYETKKSEKARFWCRFKAYWVGLFLARKYRKMISEDPLEVMRCCEEHLTYYLFNRRILEVLADAAIAADALFIAIETIEIICARFPNEGAYRKKLQELRRISETADAIEKKSVSDEIEDIGLDNSELSDADDLRQAISRLESELAENDSFEIRRQLGDYYCQLGAYDKAVEYFQELMKEGEDFDPAIDKYLEKAMLARWNEKIASEPEHAAAIEREMFLYQLERAENRVELYPNDSGLHFELGELYFKDGNFDSALDEFEQSKNNPALRTESNLYIGRCFIEKHNFPSAVEPLVEAIKEMARIDQEKMDAMYCLAEVYEELGMDDEALETYKEIYRSDISFKDVASRIEELYDEC
ncbi:MAG: tetratricopeptide repeat protein [Victivallaceae bacterium]|nr:tetratricopeptide repeat protein [Victivallaceae bacterium]MDD5662815.1 tetratricopeptide repeat protein [Victivallaceae bacterium]